MACCDQEELPDGVSRAQFNYADLPVQTFCCMGRMAYTLCANARETLLGAATPAYAEMTEAEKLNLGARVRSILVEEFSPQSDFDRLFVRVVQTMVSAA